MAAGNPGEEYDHLSNRELLIIFHDELSRFLQNPDNSQSEIRLHTILANLSSRYKQLLVNAYSDYSENTPFYHINDIRDPEAKKDSEYMWLMILNRYRYALQTPVGRNRCWKLIEIRLTLLRWYNLTPSRSRMILNSGGLGRLSRIAEFDQLDLRIRKISYTNNSGCDGDLLPPMKAWGYSIIKHIPTSWWQPMEPEEYIKAITTLNTFNTSYIPPDYADNICSLPLIYNMLSNHSVADGSQTHLQPSLCRIIVSPDNCYQRVCSELHNDIENKDGNGERLYQLNRDIAIANGNQKLKFKIKMVTANEFPSENHFINICCFNKLSALFKLIQYLKENYQDTLHGTTVLVYDKIWADDIGHDSIREALKMIQEFSDSPAFYVMTNSNPYQTHGWKTLKTLLCLLQLVKFKTPNIKRAV